MEKQFIENLGGFVLDADSTIVIVVWAIITVLSAGLSSWLWVQCSSVRTAPSPRPDHVSEAKGDCMTLASGQNVATEIDGASRTVWVLRRWDRHDDVVSLWSSEAKAREYLARYVGDLWDNVAGEEGVPDVPPSDNQQTVDLYYGPQDGWDEQGYGIYPAEVDNNV